MMSLESSQGLNQALQKVLCCDFDLRIDQIKALQSRAGSVSQKAEFCVNYREQKKEPSQKLKISDITDYQSFRKTFKPVLSDKGRPN